jgi:hypothetical protein
MHETRIFQQDDGIIVICSCGWKTMTTQETKDHDCDEHTKKHQPDVDHRQRNYD